MRTLFTSTITLMTELRSDCVPSPSLELEPSAGILVLLTCAARRRKRQPAAPYGFVVAAIRTAMDTALVSAPGAGYALRPDERRLRRRATGRSFKESRQGNARGMRCAMRLLRYFTCSQHCVLPGCCLFSTIKRPPASRVWRPSLLRPRADNGESAMQVGMRY